MEPLALQPYSQRPTPRRPALPVAAALVAGIFAHHYLPAVPGVWLMLIVLLLVVGAIGWRWRMADLALMGAALLAGICAAQLQWTYFPADHIGHLAQEEPKPARMRLRIEQPPRLLVSSGPRPIPPRQVMQAQVIEVEAGGQWRPASGRVNLQLADAHPELAVGQSIEAFGMLQRPTGAFNPGEFDWADYYRRQRIVASVHVRHRQNVAILQQPSPGPLQRLRRSVRQTLADGFTPALALDHALLRAILVGDSDPQLRDVQQQFQRTGTGHHIAISGMHVAIVGGLIYLFCRIIRIPPRRSAWIGMTWVLLYGLVVLPSPPVVRSVMLCTAFAIGLLWRRSLDGVQLLCVTITLVLLYNPIDLYAPGFQLSFGTVLGLMLFTGPLLRWLQTWQNRHVLIARQVQPPRGWEALRLWLGWKLMQVLAAAAVAWVVSSPIIALHFRQLNPWAIPGSVMLAPIVFLALGMGVLKVLLTALLPTLAPWWAYLAAQPIAAMRWTVDALDRLPGADVPIPPLPLWLMGLFYLLLVLPMARWGALRRWLPQRAAPTATPESAAHIAPAAVTARGALGARLLRIGPVAACMLILAWPLLVMAFPPRQPAGLQLTLLSVGAGQAAVLRLPSGQIMLLDAGSTSRNELYRRTLAPYFRHQGIGRIDAMLLTHPDFDHISAAGELAAERGAPRILWSSVFRHHSIGNATAESLLLTLDELPCIIEVLSPPQRIDLGDGVELEVLWPPPGTERLSPNDASLVVRLHYAGRTVLLPSDIQDVGKRTLLGNGGLASDVLVSPHHGSLERTSAEFLAAVRPELILTSNGAPLSQKQRAFDALAGDIPHHRTHLGGALTLHIAPDGTMAVYEHRRKRR